MLDQIFSWPLFAVFKTWSHSLNVLGACMANMAQPPCSVYWRLLGGLTKHCEELNVNESGTHGFNFRGNSHVLGNEGGQCLAKCALIYLTPKYTPSSLLSSPQSLVNVKPWLSSQAPCNLERFEFLERAFRKPCPTSKPKPLSHGFPLVNGVKLRQGCDDGSSVPKLTTPATHGSLHFLQWKFSCRRCALRSVSANKDQVYFSGKPLLEWRSRLK